MTHEPDPSPASRPVKRGGVPPSDDDLVVDFFGCSGRLDPDTSPPAVRYAIRQFDCGNRLPVEGNYAFQWTRPGVTEGPPQPVPGSYLLFSGPLTRRPTVDLIQRIVRTAASGYDQALAQLPPELSKLPAELSGCVVTPQRIVIFRGLSRPDQIFFRASRTGIVWSTDPRHLFDGRLPRFDKESLWRSCRGEDVFVYPELGSLHCGELVILDLCSPNSPQYARYDRITPLDLPHRTTLREYAHLTYDLLLEEIRPYADNGGRRVGVLFSGGVDSSNVLAALVDHGADVVAYHMAHNDPLADEYDDAQQVCRHLSVPLVTIPRVSPAGDYFSNGWDFPHPFNHPWLRSLEGVADRISADGINVVLAGYEGDIIFGPLQYGLHDIIAGDVRRREKWRMLQGLIGSRWELRRILRSAKPSYSLYSDPEGVAEEELGSDFLTPMPDAAPPSYDLDFVPQEHTLNLVLWRPRGIYVANPLGGRQLRSLAARLPDAYRLIPFGGRTIDKPVLRLAAAQRGLPPAIWRHYGRTWLSSPDETWCLRHPDAIAQILGAPDSRLIRRGIVDRHRLAEVLAGPRALRRNADNLLCSAMVELFLRDLESKVPLAQRS